MSTSLLLTTLPPFSVSVRVVLECDIRDVLVFLDSLFRQRDVSGFILEGLVCRDYFRRRSGSLLLGRGKRKWRFNAQEAIALGRLLSFGGTYEQLLVSRIREQLGRYEIYF